jgi:hypothetical protein
VPELKPAPVTYRPATAYARGGNVGSAGGGAGGGAGAPRAAAAGAGTPAAALAPPLTTTGVRPSLSPPSSATFAGVSGGADGDAHAAHAAASKVTRAAMALASRPAFSMSTRSDAGRVRGYTPKLAVAKTHSEEHHHVEHPEESKRVPAARAVAPSHERLQSGGDFQSDDRIRTFRVGVPHGAAAGQPHSASAGAAGGASGGAARGSHAATGVPHDA